jgi:exodeoxyribonuclease VII small subunit
MTTKPNLQEKLNKLDETIKYFEDNNKDFDLDQGLAKYDEAMQIVQTIKSQLQSYELKINEIQSKYAGETEETD